MFRSDPQFVIFLGVPGAGKGTQVQRLAHTTGLPHVSTGNLFRDHLRRQTELGKLAQTYMNEGALVPDAVTVDMARDRLAAEDCIAGALLDGFPRNLAQASAMSQISLEIRARCSAVLLDLDDSECLRRITGRRQCQECGAVFHVLYQPPRVPDQCDRCPGALYQREDDTTETVQKRILAYYKETAPLLGFYYAQNSLHTINAEGTPDTVATRLQEWWLSHVAGPSE